MNRAVIWVKNISNSTTDSPFFFLRAMFRLRALLKLRNEIWEHLENFNCFSHCLVAQSNVCRLNWNPCRFLDSNDLLTAQKLAPNCFVIIDRNHKKKQENQSRVQWRRNNCDNHGKVEIFSTFKPDSEKLKFFSRTFICKSFSRRWSSSPRLAKRIFNRKIQCDLNRTTRNIVKSTAKRSAESRQKYFSPSFIHHLKL